MTKLVLGLLALGLTIPASAQIIKTEQLSEVVVYATNYKYLQNVNTEEVASVPVELLERKVAAFNLKDSEYYEDDWGVYSINFYIPNGRILAAYDSEGKLLRTAERFKNVKLPKAVKKAVSDRYPGWKITKDVYLVNYNEDRGVTKKYKIKLKKGDDIVRVKRK